MLDLKKFNFIGEEYVILKMDTLEDIIRNACVLQGKATTHYYQAAAGIVDEDFDVSTTTVGEIMEWSKSLTIHNKIVDRIMESI